MEKEKKIVKKETKKETKKTDNTEFIFSKDNKRIARIIAMVLSFLAACAALFTFIFGIITSLKVANVTKEELLKDNFSVTFLANVNNVTIAESEDIIQGYGNKTLLIIFDIVIPCIAIIAISILIIILAKKLLDFVSSIYKEKDIYTEKRLKNVERMACIADIIISISFIIFNRPSLLLYLFVSMLLFIVIGLFRKCVKNSEK